MDPVVHFELPYDNQQRIVTFYNSVFGWKLQILGEEMGNYVLVTTAESDVNSGGPAGAINGGFYPKQPDSPAQYPSIVIAVNDIHVSMKKVTDAGGEVLGQPMEISGIGQYVSFLDTESNRNSMLQSVS